MLFIAIFCTGLLLSQGVATFILLSRLLKGARRRSPLQPVFLPAESSHTVSVVVPTLNEAARISPCLTGLAQQGAPLREILVVDSRSTDGTQEVVEDAQQDNPRLKLLTDDPLPEQLGGSPLGLELWL